MFGKEGKRADYTPYSCMKVILSNPPSQGDYHGELDEYAVSSLDGRLYLFIYLLLLFFF